MKAPLKAGGASLNHRTGADQSRWHPCATSFDTVSDPPCRLGSRWQGSWRLFGEIRPAATMMVVAALNPSWRIEIEAGAILDRAES
jgi:hypothetical protein